MVTLYVVRSEDFYDAGMSEILFSSFSEEKAKAFKKEKEDDKTFDPRNTRSVEIDKVPVPELEEYCGSPLTVDRCEKCVDCCEKKYLRLKQ